MHEYPSTHNNPGMNEDSFINRCVADLAWAVASPPLLNYPGSDCSWFSGDWCRERYRMIEQGLHELDQDPRPLQELLDAQKDRRLGNYFETLWSFALELDPRYRLIERNLQIHDDLRTLGEMDFIVLDQQTGRYAHWELAIKFYLGTGDTVNHAAWHGPNKKDRLDLKVQHLVDRQILLSTHPLARAQLKERGIVISECAVILKGRLFYPWRQGGPENYPYSANPAHLAGHWLTRDQFMRAADGSERYIPLIRSGWMSEIPTNGEVEAFSAKALISRVDAGIYRLPLYVADLRALPGKGRFFIVGNKWPDAKT